MANNDLDKPQVSPEVPRRNSAAMALLTGSLALALAGNVFLLVRSSRLNDEISSLRDNTQAQFARLDSSVAAQQSDYKERLQAVNESVSTTGETATDAVKAMAKVNGYRVLIVKRVDLVHLRTKADQLPEWRVTLAVDVPPVAR